MLAQTDPIQATPPRRAGTSRWLRNWRWWLPLLAIVLFAATTAALLWFTYRSESADRNEQLIADTLWVKQSIEFQLARHEEMLRSTALALNRNPGDARDFQSKAQFTANTNREIERIAHIGGDGHVITAVASPQTTAVSRAEARTARLALDLGRETYVEEAADEASGTPRLLFAVPINEHAGAIVVTYSLQGILDELVPWWFAQDNEISIANAFGEPLATRRGAAPPRGIYRHQSPLDLRGVTLLLATDSVKGTPSLLPNLLATAVALLSITLIASLGLLWQDVRRRLLAERRLSAELSFRKAMENSLETGLRARDMAGRVTYVNPAFCKIVGYTPEEVIGQVPPMPYWDTEHFEDYHKRFAQVLAGTVTRQGYETVFRRRNGELIQVLIFEAPLIDAQGKQTGWMSSILDITDRKRVEDLNRQQQEKLQSTARLAVMGEMASTLSHELNQPLSAITSYTTGCINLMDQRDERIRPALERIQQQAARAGQIIRSVHDFVRRREPAKEVSFIADIVDATMPLMLLQARKAQVRIECTVDAGLPPVLAERVMIEQVLLNLTRNAIEAMTGLDPERRVLQVHASSAQDTVEVAVIDHGHGIGEEAAAKLFTPFFTTKDEGMGMGLNICRTTIEFHRGRLWFEPTPGGGATFRFTLPT